MSDRPGTGGPSDEPEYHWLYGGRPPSPSEETSRTPGAPPPGGPGRPGDADHEATQVMPVQPRPGAAGPPTQRRLPTSSPQPPAPVPAPTPAPTPGGRPGGGTGGARGGFWARRLRRPGFYVRTVLVVLLLWLVYTIAVPFIAWQSAEEVAYQPNVGRPTEQDGTTYLLVGSDSRRDLSQEERQRLATGNPQSELTDTIMLLHTGGGPSVLLSIPRDTQISTDFYSGKINGAYAQGGARMLTRIVEQQSGIRVDEYVEIGLGGVADVVDAIGGIEICPVERLQDPEAGIDLRRGCQEADGETALGYARSRKESVLGDLARVQRQREVISAIGDKVLSPWSVINPVRWYRLNTSVSGFFGFGEGTSAIDAGRWALAMSRTASGDNLTCTMPVTDATAETWDRERADPLFAAIIDNDTEQITDDLCTASGLPTS